MYDLETRKDIYFEIQSLTRKKEKVSVNKIAKEFGISWNAANRIICEINEFNEKIENASEEERFAIATEFVYGGTKKVKERTKRALNDDVKAAINKFIELGEKEADKSIKKENFSSAKIYRNLKEQGFNVSYETVNNYLKKLKNTKECKIKQIK